MLKSLRRILLSGVLFSAMCISLSAAYSPGGKPKLQGEDYVDIEFTKRPADSICDKKPVTFAYSYKYVVANGGEPPAPLVLLYPKKSGDDSVGVMITTATKGKFSLPTKAKVGYDGFVTNVYTPDGGDRIDISITITYPKGPSTSKGFSLRVKKCRAVKFLIKAVYNKIIDNNIDLVAVKGDGDLMFSDTGISGDIKLEAMVLHRPDNATVKCKIFEGAKGKGSVHVTGLIGNDAEGKPMVFLYLVYADMKKVSNGSGTCFDRLTKKKTDDYDIEFPETYNPGGGDLANALKFPEGVQTIPLPFQDASGEAIYTLRYDPK